MIENIITIKMIKKEWTRIYKAAEPGRWDEYLDDLEALSKGIETTRNYEILGTINSIIGELKFNDYKGYAITKKDGDDLGQMRFNNMMKTMIKELKGWKDGNA